MLAGGVVAAGLLASSMVHGEAWWARYSPQIWMIPPVIAAACLLAHCGAGFSLHPKQKVQAEACTTISRIAAWAVLANMLGNSAMVAWAYFPAQATTTRELRQQLARLSQAGQPIEVDFRQFRTIRLRLDAYGILYAERALPTDASVHAFAGSQAVYRYASPTRDLSRE